MLTLLSPFDEFEFLLKIYIGFANEMQNLEESARSVARIVMQAKGPKILRWCLAYIYSTTEVWVVESYPVLNVEVHLSTYCS